MLDAIFARRSYRAKFTAEPVSRDDRICEKMAAILGVPENYELVCWLPIGKPEKEVNAPKKKSFEERAFFNHFG